MSYYVEKGTGDLVITGFDQGIAPSPHKGLGNLQAVNISTESGEVMASFSRVQQSQAIASGTVTRQSNSTVSFSGNTVVAGSWVSIGSGITGLSAGNYYVLSNTTLGNFSLSTAYTDDIGAATVQTGMTAGSATFNTSSFTPTLPVASATEFYNDNNNIAQNRYYILDNTGRLWVYDTGTPPEGINRPNWFLPNTENITSYGGGVTVAPSGLAFLNGWIFAFAGNGIFCKQSIRLSDGFTPFSAGTSMGVLNNTLPHTAFTGHQGRLYYCDGNYLGSIFPNVSIDPNLVVPIPNIQSYASYTAITTTGTISYIISGSLPTTSTGSVSNRIPAFFYCSPGGTIPSDLTANNKFYIEYQSGGVFNVYDAATGGTLQDLQTGATGTQYFNTFAPSLGSDGRSVMVFTPQRLNLPTFETSTSVGEIGNLIIIGGKTNTLYPWDQVSVTPGDVIPLPENNTVKIITVNNMAYIFSGSKGNIYVTNGSTASLVISVPDFCAGIAGTPSTYIEPYFVWGDAMYLRGRVYFSVLDQTSTKTGNCGGVWSFVPPQNFFVGQDFGLGLRMDNKNSYNTFNGYATVLLPSQQQSAKGPQYWSAWQSSVTSPLYGIDFSNTAPTIDALVLTDLIPTGTLLDKKTFSQIEYKLSAPLASGDSVSMSYRQNGTDAFVSCGTVKVESTTALSGYFSINFEKGQWLQLQATLTPNGLSTSSFVRLKEIRIR